MLQEKRGGTDLSLLWDDSQFLQEEGLCLLSSAASFVISRDLGTWSWRQKQFLPQNNLYICPKLTFSRTHGACWCI